MALWQKVKRLDSQSLCDITSFYSFNGIPVEVRDLCAIWIESSIKFLQPEAFVNGLCSQIQERISSQGNNESVIPFYIKHKLLEFSETLRSVSHGTMSAQDLHARLLACLDKEMAALKVQEEQGTFQNSGSVSPAPSTSSRSIPSEGQGATFRRGSSSWSSVSTPYKPTHPQMGNVEESYQSYSPSEFLNNSGRVVLDSEMNRIFEAVWNLDEANNSFKFKCHELRRYQDSRDQLIVLTRTNGVQQSHNNQFELQELERQISETRTEILQTASLIYAKITEIRSRTPTVLQNWMQLKSELDVDLLRWTQEQRNFANGKRMTMDIRKLQHISEYLMEVADKLRQLLRKTDEIRLENISIVSDPNNARNVIITAPDIPEQLMKLTQLIKTLVQDTFIVVHQPCQVLRNNTRFHVAPGKNDMEVGLLVGEKLGLQLTPPSVSVIIIDQETCKDIELNGLGGEKFKRIRTKGGKLLPNGTRLDYSPQTKRSAAVFRQISLKDYFRNGRKGAMGKEQTECVTEEKLCLLFRCEFTVGDIEFQIWRTSLPIVITTHVSQDSLASAVITWDNAFAQPRRIPFHVRDQVSWREISQVLNCKFESMAGTPLTQENLNYFEDQLSKIPGFPDKLSFIDLCKVHLPERKFTFWEWFLEAAKFIEQHLKDAWKDGRVMGFVDKEKAKNMLCCSGCSAGTFLLRFSDTVMGGMSIVWLHSDGKAYSLKPFVGKELASQPLVEKLNQETLHFVYPDVPKEEAFKKYYDEYKSSAKAKHAEVDDGYIRVRNQLIIDNPNIPKFCLMDKATKSTSGNYEIITGQMGALSADTNQCNENLIEIDIDSMVQALTSSPEYLASPDTTTTQHSPLHMPPNGNSISGNEYWSDESFYIHL